MGSWQDILSYGLLVLKLPVVNVSLQVKVGAQSVRSHGAARLNRAGDGSMKNGS